MEYSAALQTCTNVCITLGCFFLHGCFIMSHWPLHGSLVCQGLLAFPHIKSWRRYDISSYFSLHWTAAWHRSWRSRCNIFHPPQQPKAACTTAYPQTASTMNNNIFFFPPASKSAALAVDMKNMDFLVRSFHPKCKEFYAFQVKSCCK